MIRLRPATTADLPTLRRWDTASHLQGQIGCFDWASELPDPGTWRELLIAELNGRSIGFVQVMNPAEDPHDYWGLIDPCLRAIDIWIGEPDHVGLGHGTAIMGQALARCFENTAVEAVLVDPLATNRRAHLFYSRQGFKPVDRRLLDGDDCLVMRLDRVDWENSVVGL